MPKVLSAELLQNPEVRPHRLIYSGVLGPEAVAATESLGAIKYPEDLILCLDFHAPEVEARMPRARTRCRDFAEENNLGHVFDLNAGVGSKVVLEWGLVPPGSVVAGSGRCLSLVGGVGALGIRLEPGDLAAAARDGILKPSTPSLIHLMEASEPLPRFLSAWDVAQLVSEDLGAAIQDSIVEFAGSTESWNVDFRQSLSALVTECGALASLVQPDEFLIKELQEWGMSVESLPEIKEAEAVTHNLRWGDAVPMVLTGSESAPLPAKEDKIEGVFIGSCYGGHLADLEITAEILRKGGGVDPSVRLVVSPASMEVARAALHAGYLELFLEAGAMITVPGAGLGLSSGGTILGEGERLVSTAFFPQHPLGDPGPSPTVFISGPAAAAAAAVTGKLTDPRMFLD